jgi:hypothetical protein
MTARVWVTSAAVCVFVFCSGPLLSVGAESKPAPSLDEELLKILSADPLDEFDRELFAPEEDEKKAAPSDSRSGEQGVPQEANGGLSPDRSQIGDPLRDELGAAGVSEEENPLLEIARQMREVEALISQTQSGDRTQTLQGQIVVRLEELIKQARSCSGQRNPSQSSPKVAPRQTVGQPKQKPGTTPGTASPKQTADSNAAPGKAEVRRPDLAGWQAVRERIWGQLPPKAREQMRELPVEEFLPKYERLIEQYFRRLAEEEQAPGN